MEMKEKDQENKSLIMLSAELETMLIESEGEITEAIAEHLSQVATKVDGCVYMLERFAQINEFYKIRAEKLERIAKAAKTAEERLKEYVKTTMQMTDKKEIEGQDFRIKLSPTAPKVTVKDESKVPNKFMVEKLVISPDKKAILQAIKSGEVVEGVILEESFSLRVYPRKV